MADNLLIIDSPVRENILRDWFPQAYCETVGDDEVIVILDFFQYSSALRTTVLGIEVAEDDGKGKQETNQYLRVVKFNNYGVERPGTTGLVGRGGSLNGNS